MSGFQSAVPLTIGGSIQPTIVHEPGATPQNIVETGVGFHVHVVFEVTGAGALMLGGNFKIDVSFEGLGASAPEVDLPTVTVPVLSGALTISPPRRSYNVLAFVPPGTLPKGAYEMIATVTHENGGIPGPVAGYSDEQIIQVFPNTPVTTP
jgi:hypothetical protein